MKKTLFFIRSLNAGGAERQLVITAKELAGRGDKVTVLTFYSGGFYADELTNTNVQLLSLNKKGRWDLFAFIFRLRKVLHRQAPDVIYSFLGIANSLTVLFRPFIPATRIVWGVRASNMDLAQYDWLFCWSYRLECYLSRFADTIIANSHAGLEYAVEHGFPRKKMLVIPNGIDTERFYPNKLLGKSLRKTWGVAKDEFLIGVVGRIEPMKGILVFLESVAMIKQQYPQLRFVWVGAGESSYEEKMRQLATKLSLDDVLIWAGRHTDMFAVYNAFNITSSSSYSEGFPNVIGEAMACGVPCVVTDVGDSAMLVGDTGLLVPAKASQALAMAWTEMLVLDKEEFGRLALLARKRVVDEFSVRALIDKTDSVLVSEF